MIESRGHPNRLGARGWVVGGRWGMDRYLYSLHRLTGLGLLLYFLLHIVATSYRAQGRGPWEAIMERLSAPVFVIGEYLVFVAFVFHAINGIRLVLAEVGIGVGRPIEPVYPYRTVLNVQRPVVLVAAVVVAGLVVLGGLDFFVWH